MLTGIELLDSVGVEGLAEISPTRFLLRLEVPMILLNVNQLEQSDAPMALQMTFWHFYFAVQVSGGVPKGEGSGGLTLRLEAGSKVGQVCITVLTFLS